MPSSVPCWCGCNNSASGRAPATCQVLTSRGLGWLRPGTKQLHEPELERKLLSEKMPTLGRSRNQPGLPGRAWAPGGGPGQLGCAGGGPASMEADGLLLALEPGSQTCSVQRGRPQVTLTLPPCSPCRQRREAVSCSGWSHGPGFTTDAGSRSPICKMGIITSLRPGIVV